MQAEEPEYLPNNMQNNSNPFIINVKEHRNKPEEIKTSFEWWNAKNNQKFHKRNKSFNGNKLYQAWNFNTKYEILKDPINKDEIKHWKKSLSIKQKELSDFRRWKNESRYSIF